MPLLVMIVLIEQDVTFDNLFFLQFFQQIQLNNLFRSQFHFVQIMAVLSNLYL